MGAIARHRDDLDRPGEIRMAAARWLDGMVEAGCLDFLVDRICRKDAVHTDEIAALLGTLGEAAVGAMLQRLTAEEVMSARRRLIAAVVAQGDLALPQILRGLEDGRWFVVRNMAAILGELGTEGTVEALGHPVGKGPRRVGGAVREALGLQAVSSRASRLGSRKAVETGGELEVFGRRELAVDEGPVACKAGASLRLSGGGCGVESIDKHTAP